MSFFDEIFGKVGETIKGSEGQRGLVEGVLGLLTNKETGGLGGLMQTFKQKGLEDIISSWVGSGENAAITPEQIQAVLGSETVQHFAEKSGIPMDAVKAQLAELLPTLIDHVTPEGKIPEGGLLDKGPK
jgi:uncharacterized protein YidB (DUF937 family)